ncbi:class I SAM-dependent methyltransferase [Patescibacteria group bacterium]
MDEDIRQIVREGYERGDYAGHYRDGSMTELQSDFLGRLTALLPEGAHILDLGCGTGIPFDKFLVDQGFSVTGIDFTSKHIERARKNLPSATFLEGDYSRFDFGDSRFQAILALYTVFHIPREEQQNLFEKISDLLTPSGIILVSLGFSGGEGVEDDWCGARMAWSTWDKERYRTMISTHFDIIWSGHETDVGDQDELHWWVLARKK